MLLLFATAAWAGLQGVDTAAIDAVLVRKGTEREGVYRVNFPRRDLNVMVGEVKLEPAFALTTWAAFSPMGHGSKSAMLMGDFVVTAAELPKAQRALLDGGIRISGVHNHVVGETPQVMYMHYTAKGDAAQLAKALLEALKTTGTPLGELPPPAPSATPDWNEVETILKYKGARNGSVLNLSIPRANAILHEGEALKAPNGANSSLNFQMLADGSAVATSDLVLLADEVDAVIAALHKGGVTVTALHNHMLLDEPRTFHLHTWGMGKPSDLARTFRAALDRMGNR